MILKPGAYMSELGDVDVGCNLDCGCISWCGAGLGCCRQEIKGSEGSMAFLNAGGTLVFKDLKDGETVTIDAGSLVGFEDSAKLGCAFNGGFCTCCCGGEGCFSTTITGPGRVYMQSMSYERFSAAVAQTISEEERGAASAGSAIGLGMELLG